MVRVLFICLGNICRSPMAEAVFRHFVKEAELTGKIEVDSAGTGSWHIGEPPHQGTRKKLDEQSISYAGMRGRKVETKDLQDFHYIIAMDAGNLGSLHTLAGHEQTGYIARLLDFLPDSDVEDVPDPYFTGGFDEVYKMVEKSSRQLLSFIRERENL